MKLKIDIIKNYIHDRGYGEAEFSKALNVDSKKLNSALLGRRLTEELEYAFIKYFTPTIAQFVMEFESFDFQHINRRDSE